MGSQSPYRKTPCTCSRGASREAWYSDRSSASGWGSSHARRPSSSGRTSRTAGSAGDTAPSSPGGEPGSVSSRQARPGLTWKWNPPEDRTGCVARRATRSAEADGAAPREARPVLGRRDAQVPLERALQAVDGAEAAAPGDLLERPVTV